MVGMKTIRLVPCVLGLLLVACGGRVEETPASPTGAGTEAIDGGGNTSSAGGSGGTAGVQGTAGAGGALIATSGVGGDAGSGSTAVASAPPSEPVCDVVPPVPTENAPPANCGCTRRPGPGNSPSCPVGANESVTVTVGPSGGTIVLWGQQGKGSGAPMRLDIPAGALSVDTAITITETSFSPPASFIDYSPVWQLAPVGLTFDKPVKIIMPWGNEDGTVDGPLASYWSADGCAWEKVPDSYVNAGFENASIVRLGYGFVGYPKTSLKASCPLVI